MSHITHTYLSIDKSGLLLPHKYILIHSMTTTYSYGGVVAILYTYIIITWKPSAFQDVFKSTNILNGVFKSTKVLVKL